MGVSSFYIGGSLHINWFIALGLVGGVCRVTERIFKFSIWILRVFLKVCARRRGVRAYLNGRAQDGISFVMVVVVVVVLSLVVLSVEVAVAVVNLKRSFQGAGRTLKGFLIFSLNFKSSFKILARILKVLLKF